MSIKYLLISIGLYFVYLSSVSVSNIWKVNWDGIIFSQQWPITACILHKEQRNHSSCNIYPNMSSWTVHGLWPTKFGQRGPNNCNSSWTFNEGKIVDLEPLLVKYWTNIFAETAEDNLWEHEWNKHGTCAAESLLLNSEYKYFLEGLRLVAEYDLVSIFALKGIVPSDVKKYTLKEIANTVSGFTDTSPIIDCMYNKKKKRHELWQIKICMNKHLFLINCDDFVQTQRVRGNCPETGIIYPSSVVSGGHEYKYTEDLVHSHVAKFQSRTCLSAGCNILKAMLKTSLFPFV